MFMLGHMYETGEGTAANIAKAFFWYKQASEYGQPNACGVVSDYYLSGIEKILQPDPKEAARYLICAIENGNGVMYGNIPDQLAESFWQSVQIILKNRGVYHGKVDGKVGPKTEQALERLSIKAEETGKKSLQVLW